MSNAKIDWYDINSFQILCECGSWIDKEDLTEDETFKCENCGSVWIISVKIERL
jgi:DNA-directed RNA polymerase subunit RPC12/RpoP